MSLFSSFKKALGFPEDYEDLDDISDLEDVDEPELKSQSDESCSIKDDDSDRFKKTTASTTSNDAGNSNSRIGKVIAGELLAVISKTDSHGVTISQSEIEDIINECLDKEYSYNQIKFLKENNSTLKQQNTSLKKEISELRLSKDNSEASRLSSARQKRAFSERLNEMERQIATLESEREQLQLENRSMINKLRGAPMPVVVNNPMVSAEMKRVNEENSRLKLELTQVKKQLATSAKNLENQNNDDYVSIEELKVFEAKLTEYESQKNKREESIKNLRIRLDEAIKENKRQAEMLQASVESEKQKAAEIASLNDTISSNLKEHAIFTKELTDEIDRLKKLIGSQEETKKSDNHGKKSRKRGQRQTSEKTVAKISAIDELMDSTDWFAPPAPGPRRKDPDVTENFGYKEQPRKSSKPINDNQLTLF